MKRSCSMKLHGWFRITLFLASVFTVSAAPQALAAEQAERAVAAVRQLLAAGEIEKHAVLKLGFKQGNINAFLGADQALQREWERATGVLLDVHVIPQQPALEMLQAGPGLDLTVARNHEYPDLLENGLIEDLTPLFAAFDFSLDDNLQDGFIRPDLQARNGGRIVAIPGDGDVAVLYLRRDLLDDPAEQAAFRKAYGRPLGLPQTWHEYEELVRFFHRPEQGFYGTVEERRAEVAWMFWLPRYLSQAAPHRTLFDAGMRPLINSPAGIAATASYVAVMPYSPPEAVEGRLSYNVTLPLFAQGKAFAAINTIAGARMFNSPASLVRGKFIAVQLPGNRVDMRVVRANTVIYGNNLVIPRGGQAKLAFLFAMWLTDPDISTRSVGVSGGFADPYRWNHLRDARIREVYSAQTLEVFAAEWASAQLPGTGLPGDAEYLDALGDELTAAARGEHTPAEAMALTAARWEAITDRRGRADQIRRLNALGVAAPVAIRP